MMTFFLGRLKEILFHRDIEYAELQACLLSLFWGLWLILFQPFDEPLLKYLYGLMSNFGPDEVWGGFFVMLGVGQTYALVTNYRALRASLMLVSFAWWSAIFLMLAFQVHGALSVPTTFLFSLSSAWGFVRVAMEPRNGKAYGPRTYQSETQPR